jgi:drug/metabolite transporter (DMT)-like permease
VRFRVASRYNRGFLFAIVMSNLSLYLACVLIWGSTWIAITFQFGVVPAELSVAYRFGFAAMLLFGWCRVKGLPLRYALRDHLLLALTGVLMFGANYVMVYYSEMYVSSGLVAVLFSTMVFMNLFGARIFFGNPMRREVVAGAVLGFAGIVLVFWPEIAHFSHAGNALNGLLLGLAATFSASLGNMVVVRNQKAGVPVVQANAWGMFYGSLCVFAFAVVTGAPIVFDASFKYLASLFYLTVFGSILAFGAYMTLVRHIGPERAGYTSVVIPVVALIISTVFESFEWHLATVAGLALCIAGNVLVLRTAPRRIQVAD